MPVTKKQNKWHEFLASEIKVPADSIWIENNFNDFSKRNHVFIWTQKLKKSQINRITSVNTGGGFTSMRGRLNRLLDEFNSDGWITSVKPSEAYLEDLHPISVLREKSFCFICGSDFILNVEKYLGRCMVHLPNKPRKENKDEQKNKSVS